MSRDVPAVRLLPMSTRQPGFRGLSIAQVQQRYFLDRLPANGGRYRYTTAGLNAEPGTIVLFQFQAHAIAMATFLRDEKRERGAGGTLCFDPLSFRTFDPVDADAMRRVWPAFRGFGQVKQFLHPGRLAQFKRRLRGVARPMLDA